MANRDKSFTDVQAEKRSDRDEEFSSSRSPERRAPLARFSLGFPRVGTRVREIQELPRASERAREIISGARITIEHREPLRGIRAWCTRCIGAGNAESEIPASDGDGE